MADNDLSKLKIDKSSTDYSSHRSKRSLFKIITFVTALIIIFSLYKLLFHNTIEVDVSAVSQVYPSQTFTVLNSSGYVVAQRKAAVASKITGRLVSISVEEGTRVKKGDIIARLESEDASALRQQALANLDVARANLEQAKAEFHEATLSYNRNKELLKEGLVSQVTYDTSEARYKKARAAIAEAEAAIKANAAALKAADVSLEYAIIRSPFDAVVLTKNADIGDIVTPLGAAANAKAAVVTIADMASLLVETDVSESNLQKVHVGQPCEIQLDAFPEVRFRGEVHMIVPTADRTKASVLVKVRFLSKDDRILPEMSAKVAFLERPVNPDEQKPRTAINPSAIIDRNGKKSVFLIKENRAVEAQITVGAQLGDMIEILSGVSAGDRVVLRPLTKMKNGMRVKVAEK